MGCFGSRDKEALRERVIRESWEDSGFNDILSVVALDHGLDYEENFILEVTSFFFYSKLV